LGLARVCRRGFMGWACAGGRRWPRRGRRGGGAPGFRLVWGV